jgi:hypothetical protein
MRAPREQRAADMDAKAVADAQLPEVEAQPDYTVYVSRYTSYRVQITAPIDTIDPTTGQREKGRPIVAQFVEGVYRNNNRDEGVRKLIDRTLQRNDLFGKPGQAEFWLASEQKAMAEAAKLKAATETLKSLPKETLDAYIASLKTDHELPAREA